MQHTLFVWLPGVNMSDSSDDEPLIKIKNATKVTKKLNLVTLKSGDSSDKKPSSELAVNSEPQRKLYIMPSKTTPPKRTRKERSTETDMGE